MDFTYQILNVILIVLGSAFIYGIISGDIRFTGEDKEYLNKQEAIAYLAAHCPSKEVFMKCEYQLDFISDATDLEDGNYGIEERWKVIWLDNLIKRHS